MYKKGEADNFIIEIEMNEYGYVFGAKFNYDMYVDHQEGWKAGDLWSRLSMLVTNGVESFGW